MDPYTQAELRRRKILENAEARLRKIKRITIQDLEKESERLESDKSILVNDPEPREIVKNLQNDNKDCKEVRNVSPLSQLMDDSEISQLTVQQKSLSNGGACNGLYNKNDDKFPVAKVNHRDVSESQMVQDPQIIQNIGNMFVSSQKTERQVLIDLYIFLILGILVRILCFVGFSSIFLNNILGPFLVVSLPRIILYLRQKPELSRMYSLMIFLGVQESRVKMPFRVFSCLRTIVQYLALYLFSFFITHCVIKELHL